MFAGTPWVCRLVVSLLALPWMIAATTAAEDASPAYPLCTVSDSAPMRIDLDFDEATIRAGAVMTIGVTIMPEVSVDQFHVTVRTEGPVELNAPVSMRRGFVVADGVVPLELAVRFAAGGVSRVYVLATATEAATGWAFSKEVMFSVLVRDDRTFAGVEAPLNLRIRAVEYDLGNQLITLDEAKARIRELTRLEGTHNQDPSVLGKLQEEGQGQPLVGVAVTDEPPSEKRTDAPGGRVVSIRVMGNVSWLDENGNQHPSIGMNIQIRDDDTIGSELIMTLAPDSNGDYDSGFFDHDDCFGCGDPDIFVRFRTENSLIDVEDGCLLCGTYEADSGIYDDFSGGTIVENFTCANTGTGPACNVLDGTTWAAIYIRDVLNGGSPLGSLRVDWPGSSGSNYACPAGVCRINLDPNDERDWDVQWHEYGHYVMDSFDFEDNPGGAHSSANCGSVARNDKEDGVQLAWGEGWPTFFGTSGQQVLGLGALNVPRVGDNQYQDVDSNSNCGVCYSIETNGLPNNRGGEDRERAIMTFMYDAWDNVNDGRDTYSVSDLALFNAVRNTNVSTFSGVWQLLIASGAVTPGNQELLLLGNISSDQTIGPDPSAPADGAIVRPGDTLSWAANVGCDPSYFGDVFNVFFYNPTTFALKGSSAPVNSPSLAISQVLYDSVRATGADALWAVTGSELDDGDPGDLETGPYLGANRALILNRPPECDNGGPYQTECQGPQTTLQVDGTGSSDPDGDALTYTWSTNCPGPGFDDPNSATPQLTVGSGGSCSFTCQVNLNVDDGIENVDCETDVTVVDTLAPSITCSPLDGHYTVDENCEVLIDVSATLTDTCCAGQLNETPTLTTDNAVVEVVNTASSINPDGTVITRDTTYRVSALTSCPAIVEVEFTGNDCCGTQAPSCTAMLTVIDEIPPVITCPEPITLERGDKICLRCVGGAADGDPCDEAGDCPGGICVNPVEHWLESVSATDNCPGEITIADNHEALGFECGFPYGSSTDITFTATDACGNSDDGSTCVSTITIEPADRVGVTQKGSLLFYSKVEIKWDESGNVTQDTFLDLTNDYPEDVFVQLYFVNGDAPLDEVFAGDPPQLVERDHPGWNWVDCQIMLTGNEPTYFSALTGLPTGCQPFTVLDPGSPPGRPDLDGAAGHRVLRGYALAWAVNQFGREIQWNHLKGDAVIVNYADVAAWEYNAYSFSTRCVEQGEEPPDCTLFDDNGVCCEAEVIPGRLDMDAFQYDFNFSKLLLDFYASGSQAFSNGGVIASVATDLTLYPASADLRQDTEGPVVTKAKFDIWNMNEIRFSGTTRCIACWDQTLLSRYGAPNHFMLGNLHTDKGKARINGVASTVVCGPLSENAAMLGVAKKVIGFSGVGTGVAHAGMTLVGMGEEAATLLYDVIAPPAGLLGGGDADEDSVGSVSGMVDEPEGLSIQPIARPAANPNPGS